MQTSDFDFHLPPDLVAQAPASQRDQSRLLVLRRHERTVEHLQFPQILSCLRAGDVLVLNNSRVINARLRGNNLRSGGRFELFLLEENAPNDWWAMAKPGKRAAIGTQIRLVDSNGVASNINATVTDVNSEGHRRIEFQNTPNILDELARLGQVPLPPYIRRSAPDPADIERYQTVYARDKGSLAAPTAGLHFTRDLISRIQEMKVQIAQVTLHVGLGTFAPVKAEHPADHVMHEERFSIDETAAAIVNSARTEGRRIVAVGTTSLRVLETVGQQCGGRIRPGQGRTRLFLHPPARFTVVDALLTNFHLPRSTLLMLACAFAAPGETRGREMILAAYEEAVRERYRFFSYGDAMLIL